MTQYNIQDGGGFHHVYFLIPQEWSIKIHIKRSSVMKKLPPLDVHRHRNPIKKNSLGLPRMDNSAA